MSMDPNNVERVKQLNNMPSNSKHTRYSAEEDFEKEKEARLNSNEPVNEKIIRARPENVVVTEPAVDLKPREDRRAERPAVESSIQGKAVRHKKSFGTKFKEAFVGDEHDSVSDMVAEELADGAKDLLWDLLSNAISIVLFGSSRGGGRMRSRGGYDYSAQYAYGRPSRRRTERERSGRASRNSRDFDDVVVDTKDDADWIIGQLMEYISSSGYATVGDLMSLARLRPSPTDEDWGWCNLRTARPRRVNDGWLIDLPRAEPIQ